MCGAEKGSGINMAGFAAGGRAWALRNQVIHWDDNDFYINMSQEVSRVAVLQAQSHYMHVYSTCTRAPHVYTSIVKNEHDLQPGKTSTYMRTRTHARVYTQHIGALIHTLR